MFILARGAELWRTIGYVPYLWACRILLGPAYRIMIFPEWRTCSHFCYLLHRQTDGFLFLLKVRNSLSVLYNRFSKRELLSVQDQRTAIHALSPDTRAFFPHVECLHGMLVMQFIDNASSLDKMSWTDVSEAAWACKNIQHMFAALHRDGYVHGDVKAKNILFQKSTKRFFLIDIDYLELLDEQKRQREQDQVSLLCQYILFLANKEESSAKPARKEAL